jgi:hypothetical protein
MSIKKLCKVSAAFALLGSSLVAHAHHGGQEHEACHDIRAVLHELKTNDNCTSPFGFCAAGTIDGNFGLDGTTFFSVDGSAPTPPEAPGTSSYTGSYTITTPRGVLTMRETGISYPRTGNPEGGVLASIVEVQSGTGRYEDVTGILFFYGHNGRGLPSNVDVSGTLCSTHDH